MYCTGNRWVQPIWFDGCPIHVLTRVRYPPQSPSRLGERRVGLFCPREFFRCFEKSKERKPFFPSLEINRLRAAMHPVSFWTSLTFLVVAYRAPP